MSTVARKSILVVGLGELPDKSHTTSDTAIRQGGSTERIRASVEEMASSPDIRKDFVVEVVFVSPNEVPQGIKEYRQSLSARTWDGVIIGFGIRGVPEFTRYFEDLVNVTREVAPQARFGFTESPNDMKPCVLRLGNRIV